MKLGHCRPPTGKIPGADLDAYLNIGKTGNRMQIFGYKQNFPWSGQM